MHPSPSPRPDHPRTDPAPSPDAAAPRSSAPKKSLLSFCLLAALAALTLASGPPLGEHETIVAQIARQTLQSGSWLVPQWMDSPFLIKPPLAPWVVAALSRVLPGYGPDGLPVTDFSARLPSALAMLLTVFVIHRLARSMFGRGEARIAAFVCATALGTWLYAVNATAEALLTLFCTWSFAEFWWSQRANAPAQRRAHLVRFYLALGLAMLAKGPMPLAVVVLPLVAWWWGDRPTRALAAGGLSSAPRAARLAARQAWSRTRTALRTLGLWWGVPLFLLLFVPWMVAVARKHPYAWQLWNYEYLQRLAGVYPGDDREPIYYYLPILLGLLLPWSLSLPEALAAPFLAAYRRQRRPLTFAWFWTTVTFLATSAMMFKKPYYILPALPGCALLLTPVLSRLFFREPAAPRRAAAAVGAILLGLSATMAGLWLFARAKYPDAWSVPMANMAIPACAVLVLAGVALAGALYVRSRTTASFSTVGLVAAVAFTVGWRVFGPTLDNAQDPRAVATGLDRFNVPRQTPLYWITNRPDARLEFYDGRPVRQVTDIFRLVAEGGGRMTGDDMKLLVARRACDFLARPEEVYMVFNREQFHQLMAFLRPAAWELFSVDRGRPGDDRTDWVVVTNRRPHEARPAPPPA